MSQKDKDVIALQTKLKDLGFYLGQIDGDFGDITFDAVMKAVNSVGTSSAKVVNIPSATAPDVPETAASAGVADRSGFYDEIRDDLGVLSQSQVEGFETLIQAWTASGLTDPRWFAYMLATAWHETGRAMKPVTEEGGDRYLRHKKYYPYIGRGYVQLSWKNNYQKYGIAATPQKALEPAMAAHIMIDGMVNGVFTGKKLSDYFGKKSDAVGARYIINGQDKAKTIAVYYETFLEAVNALPKPDAVPAPAKA